MGKITSSILGIVSTTSYAFSCRARESCQTAHSFIKSLRGTIIGEVMGDHKNPFSKDDIGVFLLSAPFIAIARGLSLSRMAIVSMLGNRSKQAEPAVNLTVPAASSPVITANPEFVIADRIHSMMYGQLKVCFYQYSKLAEIRAIARKNGVSRQVIFTPEIATKAGFGYHMDGAIAWVRETGFANAPPPAPVVAVPKTEIAPAAPAHPPMKEKSPPKQVVNKVQAGNSIRSRTYVGRIKYLGNAVKPGLNGKPDYETFVLKLDSESLAVEKEFIGEHLAELADQYNLVKGNTIELTTLGKTFFAVMVDGKEEQRSRNGYAIKVIAQ